MVINRWKRVFQLQCEECGTVGPLAFFKVDAVREAEAKGWVSASGLACAPDKRDLCPFCVKVLDDEDAFRDYQDEREHRALIHAGVG